MDIEQIWSATLGVLALASTTLAGNRRRSAWVVGMISQAGWIGFMLLTSNYGFLMSIIGFTAVYVRNFVSWTRNPPLPSAPPSACGRLCSATARP
jgi:hypothetical protein